MKKIIATNNAPAAIGPYSQGIQIGNLVYTSGQIPVDPATGVMPATIEEQTRTSLSNVKAILEQAGSGMDKVIKTTVFLKDMNDFAAMNEVYKSFFVEGNYPARSAVQVARLPKDALVEIEAIAEV
ncbi:MAG: RidA family protein [Oscillospiraceae bacterium]|nr:RidA family protein [Oscillospiraceae bacterium]